MEIVTESPKIVTINVTDSCDAKCLYCHCWRSKNKDSMNLSTILNYIQEAKNMGTKAIRISGGEPTIQPELPKIIRAIKMADQVSMTCTSAKGDFVPLQNIIEAGLNILSISIDLLDSEKFKRLRGYSLEPVLTNLSRLIKLRNLYNFEIIISTVLTRINVQHLDELLCFIEDQELLFNITPFQTGNVKNQLQKEIAFKNEDRQLIEAAVSQLKDFAQKGVRIINSDSYLDGFPDFLINRQLPRKYVCKAGDKEAVITSDGRIKLCHSMQPLLGGSFLARWNSPEAIAIRLQMNKLKCPSCWLSCYADERRANVISRCDPTIIGVI